MPESTAANRAAALTQEPSFGQMHVQNVRGFTYLYASVRTTMDAIKADIEVCMTKVEAARDSAGITVTGPYVFAYTMGGDMSDFEMRTGFPVAAGTQPAGGADVADVPDFRCATLVYVGSLSHIGRAWENLVQAMRREGLTPLAESREWYLYFEGEESANNVIMLQQAI